MTKPGDKLSELLYINFFTPTRQNSRWNSLQRQLYIDTGVNVSWISDKRVLDLTKSKFEKKTLNCNCYSQLGRIHQSSQWRTIFHLANDIDNKPIKREHGLLVI